MFMFKPKAGGVKPWRRFLCCVLAFLFLTACTASQDSDASVRTEVTVFDPSSFGTTVPMSSMESGGVILSKGDGILPSPPTGISARGAVLMEASSGDVVFAQNPNAKLPMASTTKIMTALVALEALPLNKTVTIPKAAVGIEGSSIYLCEGETLTVEQLLYALLLASANDAAVAIAIAVSGSVEAFAEVMNSRAQDLGLTSTHFVNPHGLDDPNHYTTPRELAMITREALQNPDFRRICSTQRKTIPLHGEEGVRLLINHNKLLKSYEGCIGVKTGYTKKTGRCLVSAAEREGVTLIAVTLGAPDDWRDHTAMLDYGFGSYVGASLCESGDFSTPLWIVSGVQEYVMVENYHALTVTLPRNHGEIFCIAELPRFIYAPLHVGDTVGKLLFYERKGNGQVSCIGQVSLHACYGVEAVRYKKSLWERLTRWAFPE